MNGYMFILYGNLVSWKINLPIVSLSIAKVEYIACRESAKEDLWLKGLVESLELCKGKVKVMCDNQGAI